MPATKPQPKPQHKARNWTKVKSFFHRLATIALGGIVLYLLLPGIAWFGDKMCSYWNVWQPPYDINPNAPLGGQTGHAAIAHWVMGVLHLILPFALYGIGTICRDIGKNVLKGVRK